MRRALLALVLSACASPRAPVAAPVFATPACDVHGAQELASGAKLFTDARGDAASLRFRGWKVWLDVRVDGAARYAAHVRASEGPTMHFDGFVDATDVDLFAAHDLLVVREHVTIAQGAPVRVAPGGVESAYSQGLADAYAQPTCDALSLAGTPPREAVPTHHLAADTFTLFDRPGGVALRTLKPRNRELFPVTVRAMEGAWAHVVNDDWIRIDGWVRASELAAGEPADCDDCRGSIRDIDDACLTDVPGDDELDGCPDHGEKEAVTTSAADVIDDHGAKVGRVDAGAKIWILVTEGSRIRVLPRPPSVLPIGTGWWIAASAAAQ